MFEQRPGAFAERRGLPLSLPGWRPALICRARSRKLPVIAVRALPVHSVALAVFGSDTPLPTPRPHPHYPRTHLTALRRAAPDTQPSASPLRACRPGHTAPTIAPWQPLACTCCSASHKPAAPHGVTRPESPPDEPHLFRRPAAASPRPTHAPIVEPRGRRRPETPKGAGRRESERNRGADIGGAEGSSLAKRGDIPRILA